MAQIIKIKRSTTPGNAPGALETGELAINVTDGSLFFGSATTVYDSFKFGTLDVTNDLTVVGEVYSDMIKRESSNSNTTKLKSSANKWEIYAGNSSNEVMKVESSGVSLRHDLLVSGTTTLRNDLNINGGDISFVDNSKAIFGTGEDLKIYHSGTHSIIQDAGIGHLRIKSSKVMIEGSSTGDDFATFTENAGVELYYDDVKKFETTTNGITVSGSTRIETILEIGSDTDKFLMSDSGNIKYVTGTNLKSYIGAESGTVTSVAALTLGTTGTDLSSSVADSTTAPVITLNVPTASASNRGALSSTDWTTFNDKTTNLGTVTSVDTAGTVNGITLTGGDITSSGTITLGGTLGSIANSQLTNSTISLGGVTLSLGGMDTSPAFNLADAHSYAGDSDLVAAGTITSGTWNSKRLFTPPEPEVACGNMGDYVIFGTDDATECGFVYYYDGTGWELADASTVGTSSGLLAIAMSTNVSRGMMLRGMFGTVPTDPGSSGDVLYLSETPGELTNTAPTTSEAVVRVVGYALNDTPGLWFNPDNTWVELA